MNAVLGLDMGGKRIGVAVVQAGTTIAVPVGVIERKNREQVLSEIQKLLSSHKAEKIVIGLPVTLKGEMGIAAEKLMSEMEWFKARLAVPVMMWDERLTSKEVERVLLEGDVSRKRRKEVIDQLAAQRILQSYVDSQSGSGIRVS